MRIRQHNAYKAPDIATVTKLSKLRRAPGSLTCGNSPFSHLSSFYLTGEFSQLHIFVLLDQMPVKKRNKLHSR